MNSCGGDDDDDSDVPIYLYSLGYIAIKCCMHSTCSSIGEEADKKHCSIVCIWTSAPSYASMYVLSLADSMTVGKGSASLEIEMLCALCMTQCCVHYA